ncbi:MAG: hypothetical protein AAGF47_08000 [Planctomycetota bacterium]
MTQHFCSGAVGLVMAAGSAIGQGIPEAYTLVELVPAAGQPNSAALGVNDVNEVAGWSGLAGSSSPVFSLATVWGTDGIGTDLPLAFGASSSVAQDINTSGTVLIRYVGGTEQVAVRTGNGSVLTLPDPASDSSPTFAARLSEAGEVGAIVDTDGFFGDDGIVIWQQRPGGMEISLETGFLGVLIGSGFGSDPGTFAPDGTFVASGDDASGGSAHPQSFDPRTGETTEAGPAADISSARGASSSGWVVGTSDSSVAVEFLAFVARPDGSVLELAAFGCDESGTGGCALLSGVGTDALAVNEAGIVVGWVPRVLDTDDGVFLLDDSVAFIWSESAGTVELSTLIPDGSADGWQLDEATDITNSGVVVGNGINPDGQQRGFILIPRPRCAGDVNADGQVSSADFFAWVSAFQSGCD